MATVADIQTLRRLVDEPDQTTYADAELSSRLDASSINGVAADIWTEKAAKYASLVDISEGGSSRKNSELFSRAQQMAAFFRGLVNEDVAAAGRVGTVVRKLKRS